jgi:hypothetical protein
MTWNCPDPPLLAALELAAEELLQQGRMGQEGRSQVQRSFLWAEAWALGFGAALGCATFTTGAFLTWTLPE